MRQVSPRVGAVPPLFADGGADAELETRSNGPKALGPTSFLASRSLGQTSIHSVPSPGRIRAIGRRPARDEQRPALRSAKRTSAEHRRS
jgi:hypothetical protein